jgi:hypothetical protein
MNSLSKEESGPPEPARENEATISQLLAAHQKEKELRRFAVWAQEGKRILEEYRRSGKQTHLTAFNRLSEGAHDWLVGEVMRND